MPRSLPEWIAPSPDTPVPPRVRVRVFDRYEGRCQCGCNRKIMAGEAWDLEDTVALINGGENRENNKKPWLSEHHKGKTAQDVAEKSRVYRKRAKFIGVELRKGPKLQGRAFPTVKPQRTASRPIVRRAVAMEQT